MFIGHYGFALAVKKYRPKISLGLLFIAVQFMDVLFSLFVLLGIEKMRIIPGFTAYNPYDLYFMPFTHSLLGAVIWSTVFSFILLISVWWTDPNRKLYATAVAMAVFSHFLLDLPMHTADLPLSFSEGSEKIGFGLWNYKWLSLLAELSVFQIGVFLYLKSTKTFPGRNRFFASIFFSAMTILLFATPFLPSPVSPQAFAFQALTTYLGLALVADWIGRTRHSVT